MNALVRWMFICGLTIIAGKLSAQSFDKLHELKGFQTTIHYSAGAQQKATRMGKQIDEVLKYYEQQLGFTPTVTLLILSPADWSSFTTFPFYGMPHYTSNKTLIVAAQDNEYWKSMIPLAEKIPAAFVPMLNDAYGDGKGGLTMEPFFDLLAIHELGHAYTSQGGLKTQRRWMGELFPNIMLHNFIAVKQPGLLLALTLFPKLVFATTDTASLKYTTLQDLETYYNEIGPKYPQNYGWYQCRWHVAAGTIYDAGGIEAIKKLWTALKANQNKLTDEELVKLLTGVDQSVANVPLNWDRHD